MPSKTLIIGTAKQLYIRNCIAAVQKNTSEEISLFLLERERGEFDSYGNIRKDRIYYFRRSLHPLSHALIRTVITERPETIIIVCGLYYDHKNVVDAVRSICGAFCSKSQLLVYVQDQLSEAHEHSYTPLWQHLLTGMVYIFLVVIIRLVSPFVRVRAGDIFSTRIGHLAYDCEIYLCEKELGYHKGCFDLHYLKDNQAANQTLLRLFARKMHITRLARPVHNAIVRFHLDSHELKLVTRKLGTARDPECLIPATPAHIAFTEDEHKQARQEMQRLGIPTATPYVCLLGRDPVYLEWIKPLQNDSNLQAPRNMDIRDYLPAAATLCDEGFTVLRMGSKVKDPMQSDRAGVIDYANHSARSDFMDVYLSATCHFFIGSGSGLQEIPVIFRTPCLLINCFQLQLLQACSPQTIILPQLIQDNELERVLRVDEILSRGIGSWGVEQFAQSTRISLIKNTPEEILEAALEMNKRLRGTWQEQEGDAELQKRFWGHFKPSIYNSCFKARIGAHYLRQHAGVLLLKSQG